MIRYYRYIYYTVSADFIKLLSFARCFDIHTTKTVDGHAEWNFGFENVPENAIAVERSRSGVGLLRDCGALCEN